MKYNNGAQDSGRKCDANSCSNFGVILQILGRRKEKENLLQRARSTRHPQTRTWDSCARTSQSVRATPHLEFALAPTKVNTPKQIRKRAP